MSDFGFIVLALLLLAQLLLLRSQRKLIAAHRTEVAAKDELIDSLERLVGAQSERIEIMDKLSCCGCGHPIGRHDDPDSADGYGCRDCECQAVHNLIDQIERPRRI